jgi:Gpi18-like mannosyltransferase
MNTTAKLSGELSKLVLFALASRLLLLSVAYLHAATVTNYNATFLPISQGTFRQAIAPFQYADIVWYMEIAENGYEQRSFTPDKKANWAFYPLWPLLLRVNNALFGEMLFSGILLSTLFFVLAILLLYALIARDFDREIARLSAVLLIVFPASYFCLRPGPESLFLFLVIASISSARSMRWPLAGILGCLAVLTRVQGVVLLLPLLFIYYKQYRKSGVHHMGVLSLLLIPAAQLSFMAYMFHLTGNPFANLLMQEAWGNHLMIPFTVMVNFILRPHLISYYGWDLAVVSFVFVLFFLALFVLTFRVYPLPGEYILYAGLSLFFIVARDNLNGSLRYMIPIFPLFLALALLIKNRNWFHDSVIIGFSTLQIFYFVSFLQHYNWAAT